MTTTDLATRAFKAANDLTARWVESIPLGHTVVSGACVAADSDDESTDEPHRRSFESPAHRASILILDPDTTNIKGQVSIKVGHLSVNQSRSPWSRKPLQLKGG